MAQNEPSLKKVFAKLSVGICQVDALSGENMALQLKYKHLKDNFEAEVVKRGISQSRTHQIQVTITLGLKNSVSKRLSDLALVERQALPSRTTSLFIPKARLPKRLGLSRVRMISSSRNVSSCASRWDQTARGLTVSYDRCANVLLSDDGRL